MQYRELGNTGIKVSVIALGTMTWGQQNSEADAHAQLEVALDFGVNLVDTAETYPSPHKPETQGLSERYLGSWLKKSRKRSKLLVATKASYPSDLPSDEPFSRQGDTRFDRKGLSEALNGSLERLQTDYIDLYQLHWPDRSANCFGQLGYEHISDEKTVQIQETLGILSEFVKEGKIRHIGISNETPWGVSQFLAAAEKLNLSRIVSIQNPYNLLNRTFEIGLAEFTHREKISLFAYSPLAFGVLTGKYLNTTRPPLGRITLFDQFGRYNNEQAGKAAQEYVALSRRHGIDPAHFALAFVNSRPFITSNIIGATNTGQLQSNIRSIHLTLNDRIHAEIEAIHQRYPNPAP